MTLYTFIIIVALLAVIASLVWGVASMAHGGHYDKEHSEHFMIARVGFQALAFILLLMTLLFPFA